MKNFLHALPYFLLFLVLAYIPPKSYSQCSCSGGDPATPLTYYYTLDTTDAPSSTLSFPKFDPTIGILSCVRFMDTLSLISTSNVMNTATVDISYKFLLNVTNNIAGPGISVNESAIRNYGPTLLTQTGDIGDHAAYGPDTLFKYSIHSNSSSSIASYLGSTGNVNFVYTVNGGLISTQGGINYLYQIASKYWGGFSLTYYWCPSIVLATNIKNFVAYKTDEAILLKWVTENRVAGTQYKIEHSLDGNNFSPIGETKPDELNGSTQHEFQYVPGTVRSGKMYFRIKQIDAQGKVTYSPIRIVDLNENAAAGFIIYPNPVSRKVSMQFDRSLNGNYLIEVTNMAGQIVYNKNLQIQNSNMVQFEMSNPPTSGMYYLKMIDTRRKLSYSHKLIIQR